MPIPNAPSRGAVQRTLLRDTVFQKLRDAILDGTLQPGERLSDDEIEGWLGVSRTPIRDALNELSRSGLVEMSPNRYTRVATPREAEALDAIQTLGIIMGGAIRLATPRLDEVTRNNVYTQIQTISSCLKAGDPSATNKAAVELWHIVMKQCDNSLLLSLCEQSIDGLAFKLRIATVGRLFDFSSHAELFDTLGQRVLDGDAAGAAAIVHRLHLLPVETEES